jgi:PIN domain nuclease of toxin-antitoxin system
MRELLTDIDNEIFISVVTIWEIAIKRALGKRGGALPFSAAEAVSHLRASGYAILDVTAVHAIALESLPLLHGDPFDRLLVAQALSEPLRLVTHDAKVAAYSNTAILV